MAAGCLLITEAGGLLGDMNGKPTHMQSGNLLAGNPKVYEQLLQVFSPYLSAERDAGNRPA
jgi:myo-inositol-1(or 4)-monophosphatase